MRKGFLTATHMMVANHGNDSESNQLSSRCHLACPGPQPGDDPEPNEHPRRVHGPTGGMVLPGTVYRYPHHVHLSVGSDLHSNRILCFPLPSLSLPDPVSKHIQNSFAKKYYPDLVEAPQAGVLTLPQSQLLSTAPWYPPSKCISRQMTRRF